MRTLRLSLVGTIILALLGGLTATVIARTDGSIKVTGSMMSSGSTGSPEFSEDGTLGEDWVGHGRGMDWLAQVEWSDPRLPSEVQSVVNFEAYGSESDGDVGVVVANNTWLLEGQDGSWSGSWTGWCDAEGDHCRAMVTLTGHGAYEGFYAVLTEQPQEDASGTVTQMFEGAILAGEMPPVPEPLEPSVEAMTHAPSDEVTAVAASEEPAVADEDESEVSTDEDDEDLSGTATYIDGLRTWQTWEGEDTIYELEMSDPRANGTYTEFDFVGDGYDSESQQPSIAALGRVTLVNDEGSWSGHESAVWDDEMGWRLTAWLAGEDAYEGLTLYLHAHRFPVYSTPEMDFDGVIFEGEPPVMLEAVEIPAE
ncbi:MAG TPA: hypothetical protein VES02_05640 [Dermatophilaceae bacterium]|nr:hypothetical protein [Dermatophilaceae bacterium]